VRLSIQGQISPRARMASYAPALAGEPRRIVALAGRFWTQITNDAVVIRLAIGLLALDLFLTGANLIALALSLSPKLQGAVGIDLGVFLTPALSVNADQGLPEILGYGKTAATVALLYLCSRRHAQPIYLAMAVAFFIILADDALMIHETVGAWLADRFHLPFAFGLRPQDLGELSVYSVWMVTVIAVAAHGVFRSSAAHIRVATIFVAAIGLIAFFSVLVDMAEITIYWQFRRIALLIGVIEDGGKMVGMTLALVLAATLWRHPALVAGGGAREFTSR
jgi:hypothetical protein